MPNIPDIGEMAPDQWLSEMQEVREQLLDEFVRVWETCDEAEVAVSDDPAEIAASVVWLCSDDASFVTGETMVIDGGYVTQ